MATPFTTIYNQFQSKVSDYEILNYTDFEKEELLLPYLKSAQIYFGTRCQFNLSDKDEMLLQYNQDLDEEVIDILAIGMTYYWLKPMIANTDILQNNFSTRDISFFSPANLLKELQALSKDFEREFKERIHLYTYNHGDIVELKQ